MSSTTNTIKTTAAKIYGDAGLIYIRYDAEIVTRPSGDKKISGSRPPFKDIKEQIKYGPGSGKYYSLLMGREFQPGRWSILLDFDNKADETSQSGLDLAKKLNMYQYNAPKQHTPSKGLHYIFYVDDEQKKHIKSRTTITYQGVKYNMDVKFENGLCNCAPSKIEGSNHHEGNHPNCLLAGGDAARGQGGSHYQNNRHPRRAT